MNGVERPRVTMKMVAERVGLDRTTVSRVLGSQGAPGRYPARTVQRIQAAARELGYRRNLAALALKDGRTQTIGLIVADISVHFFAQVAFHLDGLCRKAGYALLICNSEENPETEQTVFRTMHDRMVDGLIVSPVLTTRKHLDGLMRQDLEAVLFDRADPLARVSSVTVDNSGGAAQAAECLLAHGHRDIALVGGLTQDPAIRHRFDGCLGCLRRHGVSVPKSRILTECLTDAEAEKAIGALLTQATRPTAVFSAMAACSIGTMRAARRLRLRIPQELSLIGFDDFPAADLLDPPIDVIRQPTERIAQETFRILMNHISHKRPIAAERIVLPVQLIRRGSCAPKLA